MSEAVEFIGKVKLDLSDYPGEDLYSEGEAEEMLLGIVRENSPAEYNRLISENPSWSMLYHLSDIRENILDFLPISKNDSVLEVGSGCGAVTGILSRKAGRVTCIDLSRKRSLINAERHKDMDNILIRVGNFRDIEEKLEERFDHIFLIGVLEYAGSYIGDSDPYTKMISMLKSRLKEGGSLVVAIENKYGLKYFAGCREDHTGDFYSGIEGYPCTDEVRTFSRDGLSKLAKEAGMTCRFYYPYPDYKLPITVFSDDRLPRISELSGRQWNFDRDRFEAFDEGRAFDEIIREGQFPFFSNSFLAVMENGTRTEGMASRRVLYSRHSVERRSDRQIRTDLEETNTGERIICKYPANDSSRGHLENMARSYERLSSVFSGTKFLPNRMKRINDGEGNLKRLEFEYLNGPTLEDELNTCRAEKKTEDALLVIKSFCDTLRGIKDMTDFEESERFKEIFGNVVFPGKMKCMPVTDTDMIFTNIICDKGWNIIDYEWTFDFPIPVDFVIYRAVFYYTRDLGEDAFDGKDLFLAAGINEEMKAVFAVMEHNFQLYIKGNRVTLPEMYSLLGKNVVSLKRAVKSASLTPNIYRVKLYLDKGEGFNENDVCYSNVCMDEDNRIRFDVTIPEGCRMLRIDPADYRCIMKLYHLGTGSGQTEAKVNGLVFSEGTVMYDTDDPQILIEKVNPGMKIFVEYALFMIPDDMFDDMAGTLSGGRKGASYVSRLRSAKKGAYARISGR
ncbi:MAG: class I SAM-dependent methyltransferase [Lachnospiraceae bacterium]|nr:class I SAM-dependent methyltransferase [Lachnospiraceae bacterium]